METIVTLFEVECIGSRDQLQFIYTYLECLATLAAVAAAAGILLK